MFVHFSAIQVEGYESLNESQKVEYLQTRGQRGLKPVTCAATADVRTFAVNVTLDSLQFARTGRRPRTAWADPSAFHVRHAASAASSDIRTKN